MSEYVETVVEDEKGDLILPIPVELLSQMGWTEETILEWEVDGDKVYLKEHDESSKSD
jgi:bifunctional DNA-binding transcriptional regulator/antitoxin component of YhaV-PrlF toxin-antitoxin module